MINVEFTDDGKCEHSYQYMGRDDMFAIWKCKLCGKEVVQDVMDYIHEYNKENRDD